MIGDRAGEDVVDAFLREAHLTAPHEVADMVARHAGALGLTDTVAYLVDLQQTVLTPLVGVAGPGPDRQLDPLAVDSTLAGRSFQFVEVLTQATTGGLRAWLPLLDGTERLGVLGVTLPAPARLDEDLAALLRRFASLVAEIVVSKTLYGDTLVLARRQRQLGLAAELQWSLLPPLTFASRQVTIAGALEPAYDVAGDSVDYAVDAGIVRFAAFDGMGHGLHSAQLAALAVAAYRNARRGERSLTETIASIDEAVSTVGAGSFVTAVVAELDTETGLLSWVNVGHPEPVLLRGRQSVKSLRVRPTLPFGISRQLGRDGPEVVVGTERLEPGDRVLVHTDGVTEIRSPAGEFYGTQRLTDLLTSNLAAGLPTPETMRRLVRALLEHQQGQLRDDATMLLVEWLAGNEAANVPTGPADLPQP
ncbi:MAG TPA: PP2C family protein-serine/threonine phosphatase [Mycobacteriales bacterium]|nr:PP2C family protein-serine/threonine phosphatase [Mycobacteriales bacterium]